MGNYFYISKKSGKITPYNFKLGLNPLLGGSMDKKEAYLFSLVSLLAYGTEFEVKDFKPGPTFENKSSDTQGMFGTAYDKYWVVAFRGSEETGPEDWITDLKFIKQNYAYDTPYKGLKIHSGFMGAYQSIRPVVIDRVKKASSKDIVCTGHSLGAALATLAAFDIKNTLPDKDVSCFTYGSPKVGNDNFAKAYNALVPNTYRFVNGPDLVPQALLVGYEHVGKLYHVGKDNAEWDGIMGKVECHLPKNYIKTLKAEL